ncbi:ferritin-like domain-containing protein [Hyalangium rubrum]|uniref:Ferritin-like domain-containing protein n=1 Tax=Hyalangium rubrum TaxID=3103134 RepID=A0ABU5H1B7_9BACT|nr:ferritin-like domain-containing protein [Hyalangium sp. s54d21]MDY7227237.1 ferritin-like domain-containing protein [Hyalangium sp. s54d21]
MSSVPQNASATVRDLHAAPARQKTAAPQTRRTEIVADLYQAFKEEGRTLVDITWEQQRLHESRRWSVVELVDAVTLENVSESDRLVVWNAGRAELTTKPGADRLARLADTECRRWQGRDATVASILQACGTWSRYWNEEEAHHETSFNQLATVLGMEPITDQTFIEFRKIFPDDDMLRTLTLLAFSEIVAAVNYAHSARMVQEPGLKALLKQVGADEIQHMTYFIAFAKGLVDSGRYPAKEAFAVAHLFLREGGEVQGSKRERVEQRETHVNWWDHVEYREGMNAPDAVEKKETLIFHALKRITGITVSSAQEAEDMWLELVGC